jgi:hypothetical protein
MSFFGLGDTDHSKIDELMESRFATAVDGLETLDIDNDDLNDVTFMDAGNIGTTI